MSARHQRNTKTLLERCPWLGTVLATLMLALESVMFVNDNLDSTLRSMSLLDAELVVHMGVVLALLLIGWNVAAFLANVEAHLVQQVQHLGRGVTLLTQLLYAGGLLLLESALIGRLGSSDWLLLVAGLGILFLEYYGLLVDWVWGLYFDLVLDREHLARRCMSAAERLRRQVDRRLIAPVRTNISKATRLILARMQASGRLY